jgi:hypothetical protein
MIVAEKRFRRGGGRAIFVFSEVEGAARDT